MLLLVFASDFKWGGGEDFKDAENVLEPPLLSLFPTRLEDTR